MEENYKNIFQYNEKYDEYRAILDGIEFTIDNDPTENEVIYATRLVKAYNDNLSNIAKFILNDESFIEFYGNFDESELIKLLKKPTIRIIRENEGVLSYCNHRLDDEHIISFEFLGDFSKMAYLTIDG